MSLRRKLIVDNFAGGGGASTGIEMALGRSVDIAINHDPQAITMHKANHPGTKHYCEDVFDVDPIEACGGQPVGLAWFSPDCKHFSKAKGGKPVDKNIRALAWVVIRWAKLVHPDVIMLENVEEFEKWGPLKRSPDGKWFPDPAKVGFTFRRWRKQLEGCGYKVELRQIRACHLGGNTLRKRLYLIARRDGKPIVWPEQTHGKGMKPYHTAAECIDWSLPTHSIFLTKEEGRRAGVNRPLAEATMRRIARGIQRYVIDAKEPFIVPLTHQWDASGNPVSEPMRTVTGANRGEMALVEPFLTEHANGSSQRNMPADEPLRTQCAQVKGGHFALVTPFLAGCGGRAGQSQERSVEDPYHTTTAKADTVLVAAHLAVNTTGHTGAAMDEPVPTVTTGGHHALIAPTLVQTGYVERKGQKPRNLDLFEPLGTAVGTGKHALVAAHLSAYYGTKEDGGERAHELTDPLRTIPTENRHAVVAAFLAQHNLGAVGHRPEEPMSTITQSGSQQQLVTSHLMKLKGTCKDGQPVTEPIATVQAQGTHLAEVRAFLLKYFGTEQDPRLDEPMHTVTAKHRFGLVTVHGVDYQIVDIGMRMLSPRELFRAQGFPDSYVIDPMVNGRPLSKTAQVKMCGNSVVPLVAETLVRLNYSEAEEQEAVA